VKPNSGICTIVYYLYICTFCLYQYFGSVTRKYCEHFVSIFKKNTYEYIADIIVFWSDPLALTNILRSL